MNKSTRMVDGYSECREALAEVAGSSEKLLEVSSYVGRSLGYSHEPIDRAFLEDTAVQCQLAANALHVFLPSERLPEEGEEDYKKLMLGTAEDLASKIQKLLNLLVSLKARTQEVDGNEFSEVVDKIIEDFAERRSEVLLTAQLTE